jgi:hypothetical protein
MQVRNRALDALERQAGTQRFAQLAGIGGGYRVRFLRFFEERRIGGHGLILGLSAISVVISTFGRAFRFILSLRLLPLVEVTVREGFFITTNGWCCYEHNELLDFLRGTNCQTGLITEE